jgi:hypothetical protein
MSQFKELQEKFFSETGICAVNSQGEPDIDYVNWLESIVEKLTASNKQSTPLRECIICGAKKVPLNSDGICRKCAR